ncbi:MAG: hypothetical protein ACI4TE_01870 [Alphaproteobacteria bacterium]
MTISSAVNKIAYTANGTSKNFTVPFYFIYKSDLKVYQMIGDVQELLTLDTDYTITGTPEQPDGSIYRNGGTVVMAAMPAAGTRFIILREVPLTQEADYQEGSTFPAALHELALDKLTMAVQQLEEKTDRSVTVDVFSDTDPSSLVSEIEALYDVKDDVVTAAENIGSIVTAAQDINAIKDAPKQAANAAASAQTAASYASGAHIDANAAEVSAAASASSAANSENSAAAAAGSARTAHDYALQAVRRNVGDIFYTSRLDAALNGAVEANGAVYAVDEFTGEQSVPELLRKGSLPFVSMSEYESIVSANGSCRAWGWDNGNTFRVPTAEKQKRVLVAKKEEGNAWYNLYSDGWCEQGGNEFDGVTAYPLSHTVTFPKPFNKLSSLTIGMQNANNSSAFNAGIKDGTVPTTTGFTVTGCYNGSAQNNAVSWFACGYAEIPSEAEYQFQNIEVHRAMVQVATGVKADATQLKEYKFNNPHFFGQSMYSDVEPSNASWLKSDGQWNSGTVYTDYYQWLLKIYNGTEVVDGVSVKLSTDTYDDYDFVINTEDQTFRLPLLDGSEDLPSDRYDSLTYISDNSYTAQANGWFSCYGSATAASAGSYNLLINQTSGERDTKYSVTSDTRLDVSLEVSRGQSIYAICANLTLEDFRFIYAKGNGSLYFYVGDTVQDASLINAGAVLGQLATKTNSVEAAAASMPSNRYIDLTLGASGSTYTALANGWVVFGKAGTEIGQVIQLVVDGATVENVPCTWGGHIPIFYHPLQKGEDFIIKYTTGGADNIFRFIYAEGDE